MVKFLTKRPVATIMSFIAVVLLGLVSSNRLPVSLLPDINIPEITIFINKENTSLHELENSITRPFRNQLLQVGGVKDIRSETKNNQAIIRLIFDFGVDIDYAFIEVNDKIDAVMAFMPNDVKRPRIIKASATDIPIFALNIFYKDKNKNYESLLYLSDFVNDVIKKRIEQLPEVAIADISGIVSPEIYIKPNLNKIRSLGIDMSDFKNAFIQNNLKAGSILVRDGHYQYNVIFNTQINTVEDIGNILIKKQNRLFALKELAQIRVRPQERKGLFLNRNQESISLAIIKHSSAQMNLMKSEVKKVLANFQEDYPELDYEITQDQTILLNYSITNLKQSLILGCILAIIIMFFFIRNPKAPLLIAFSIPVSLVISLLIFYVVGISINIISLSGLILGVGMMIDNSIIVIDNIAQHIVRGEKLMKGIVAGTNEVIRPLISSVLTTCAVFIPLIFLSGISGQLFYDQAVAVTVGLFVSLIVSITLLPVLYKLFKIDVNKTHTRKSVLFDIEKHYNNWFNHVFSFRKIYFPAFFVFILLGVILFGKLEKRQMPQLEENEIVAQIDWNQNISLENNKDRVQKILEQCTDEIQSNSYIGLQNFILNKTLDLGLNQAKIYVKAQNSGAIQVIKNSIIQYIESNYDNVDVKFSAPKNIFQRIFKSDQSSDIVLNVSMISDRTLPSQNQVNLVADKLDDLSIDVDRTTVVKQKKINLNINHKKLLLYDVEYDNLIFTLKNAFNKNQIGTIVNQNKFIPVVTGNEKETIENILQTTFVKNKNDKQILVAYLAKLEIINDYKSIVASDQGAFIPINIACDRRVKQNLDSITNRLRNFTNLNFELTGSWFQTQKLIKEMSIVLFISLLLLFFILSAQFESLIQPFIVLLEIPIDIAGAFLFLYLFGSSINILSLIGIVVMAGIIINDSILKIDTINKLREKGMPLLEAIHLGGTRRLKPIIMTSLTTILALLPFLFGSDMGSKLQQPLALAIIGGLFVGTFVSLFFVPLIYYFLYKTK